MKLVCYSSYIVNLNDNAIIQPTIQYKNKVIGVSLSEAHTSGKSEMSNVFAKIYVEIQINDMSVMCSQKFTFKKWVITYKCFQMCVHQSNDYQSSLMTLHIRLVCTFITQRITRKERFTDAPYKAGTCVHYTKNNHGIPLSLFLNQICTNL